LRFGILVEEQDIVVEELALSLTRLDFSENRNAIPIFLVSQQTPNLPKFRILSIVIDRNDYRGSYNPAASCRARLLSREAWQVSVVGRGRQRALQSCGKNHAAGQMH
jgi:hypothetical protein